MNEKNVDDDLDCDHGFGDDSGDENAPFPFNSYCFIASSVMYAKKNSGVESKYKQKNQIKIKSLDKETMKM